MHKFIKSLIVTATATVLTVSTAAAANAAEADSIHLDTNSRVSVSGTGDRIQVTFTSDHEYTEGEGMVECRALVGSENTIRRIEDRLENAATVAEQQQIQAEIHADWRDNTILDPRRSYKHLGYFAVGGTTTDSIPLGNNSTVPAVAVFCEQPRPDQVPYLEAVFTTPRSGDGASNPSRFAGLSSLLSS